MLTFRIPNGSFLKCSYPYSLRASVRRGQSIQGGNRIGTGAPRSQIFTAGSSTHSLTMFKIIYINSCASMSKRLLLLSSHHHFLVRDNIEAGDRLARLGNSLVGSILRSLVDLIVLLLGFDLFSGGRI